MSELNWNKNMKIAALWKMIFNEVWNQLIDRNMSSILIKFAVLYQQINKNLHLNQASWYQQSNIQQNSQSIIFAFLNLSVFTHNFMNINAACTQYTSAESDEWKTCLTKNECFDYD